MDASIIRTLAACAVALLLAAPSPVRAQKDCIACEQVKCLKNTLKQKVQLRDIYLGIADEFDPKGGPGWKPANITQFDKIPDAPTRNQRYRDTISLLEQYNQMEAERTGSVPAPEGCSVGATEVSTDSMMTCAIDTAQLAAAKAGANCKQLGELIEQHERSHAKACMARKAGNFWEYTVQVAGGETKSLWLPPQILTPAGKAREEAAGYGIEIAALETMVKDAERKCKTSFKGVKTSCTIPTPVGPVTMGQEISGESCGNPVAAQWTIHTVNVASGPGVIGTHRNADKPWYNDCVAKGSAEESRRAGILNGGAGLGRGWMCVYDEGDGQREPTITIRSFRLPQCSPSSEQAITVTAERSECDEDTPPQPQPDPANLPNS
jgi:hypothetical protein